MKVGTYQLIGRLMGGKGWHRSQLLWMQKVATHHIELSHHTPSSQDLSLVLPAQHHHHQILKCHAQTGNFLFQLEQPMMLQLLGNDLLTLAHINQCVIID